MIKFQVKTNKKIGAYTKKKQQQLQRMPRQAYDFFTYGRGIIDIKGFRGTPIDTGNARRSTRLSKDTIIANYPYAEVLDKGRHRTDRGMRGSRQAPRGMTKPTLQYLRFLFRRIMGSK